MGSCSFVYKCCWIHPDTHSTGYRQSPLSLLLSSLNILNMTILTGRALNWAITATAGSGFLLFGYGR